MQAYATCEQAPLGDQLRTLDRTSHPSVRQAAMVGNSEPALIDQLLGRLADLVVDRMIGRTAANTSGRADEWLDARAAAEYLGIHRDTLRKLAAQRAIPVHQDGPRCKLYFNRGELDDWRRSAPSTRAATNVLRAVS